MGFLTTVFLVNFSVENKGTLKTTLATRQSLTRDERPVSFFWRLFFTSKFPLLNKFFSGYAESENFCFYDYCLVCVSISLWFSK